MIRKTLISLILSHEDVGAALSARMDVIVQNKIDWIQEWQKSVEQAADDLVRLHDAQDEGLRLLQAALAKMQVLEGRVDALEARSQK